MDARSRSLRMSTFTESRATEKGLVISSLLIAFRSAAAGWSIASKIGKCLLVPGLVGLIAVDSFALALPIVTQPYDFHAPEFAYLTHNKDSVIIDGDSEAYSNAVNELMTDELRLFKLKSECLTNAHIFTTDKMVENFHLGVLKTLKLFN